MPWEHGDANAAWLLAEGGVWALVLARALGLCLTAPALAAPGMDWRMRLGLAALLATVMSPAVAPLVSLPASWPSVLHAAFLEVLAGGVLGWSAGLIVAGARLAGELVGSQAGLSTATLFDPEAGADVSTMGRFYGWIALVAFLALDGPLVMVRALLESYRVVPAGGLSLPRATAELAFAQVGRAMLLALQAAAPAALALALAGIVLCWLGRAASSLSFVALALPLRSMIGIVLVLISLITLLATLSRAWNAFVF
jgi:flagellar biosynthesis protein FliR